MSPVLFSLALATGAAAAFNPCGVGLLPSYVGLLVGRPVREGWQDALADGLAVGGAMTVGLLLLYVIVAMLFGLVAGVIGHELRVVGTAIGALFAAWGLLILLWPERFMATVVMPEVGPAAIRRGTTGALVYGVAFGLASLGCTFPLFLSLFVQATSAQSAVGGGLVVLAYAIGMGATVTALAVAARLFRSSLDRFLRATSRLAGRIVGLVVLGSGVFVMTYWLRPLG